MSIEEAADEWLEATPGAAFRSSVSGRVLAGKSENLIPAERQRFMRWGGLDYLMDSEKPFNLSSLR